jgi:hypothetical protein
MLLPLIVEVDVGEGTACACERLGIVEEEDVPVR